MLGHCLLDEVFCALFASFLSPSLGRNSAVGRATRYKLDGPGIESRGVGVGVEIFRTRPDRPWGPPRLRDSGYLVIPGIKLSGLGVDPHPI